MGLIKSHRPKDVFPLPRLSHCHFSCNCCGDRSTCRHDGYLEAFSKLVILFHWDFVHSHMYNIPLSGPDHWVWPIPWPGRYAMAFPSILAELFGNTLTWSHSCITWCSHLYLNSSAELFIIIIPVFHSTQWKYWSVEQYSLRWKQFGRDYIRTCSQRTYPELRPNRYVPIRSWLYFLVHNGPIQNYGRTDMYLLEWFVISDRSNLTQCIHCFW